MEGRGGCGWFSEMEGTCEGKNDGLVIQVDEAYRRDGSGIPRRKERATAAI